MATARCGNWRPHCDIPPQFKWNFDLMFYRLGYFLGLHPFKCIFAAILFCGIAACGMTLSYEELDDIELFMPRDSPIRDAAAWVDKHFQDDLLFQSVIVEADNVLDPRVLSAVLEFGAARVLLRTDK
ncbi:uncharacterized protein [Anabrus simplex]|uniref:uncharacterized protein n=1 Tax=Anabrus simplex TaxID=316456 RepID=UPI0035A3739B